MTRRLVSGAVAGVLAAAFAGGAIAQTKGYVPGTAPCSPGYVCNSFPTPTDGVVKSGVYNSTKGLSGNLCYRQLYWTPAQAIVQCDPDLVPKKPAAPPAAPPAPAPKPPAPAPKPAPPAAPQVQKVTLASKALFDFDKYALKPEGKAAIDTEIIAKLGQVQKLELVLVTGHTDPIGTQQYNQKLSERRADAVRDYLVSKGVPKDRIETLGMGKTQPIPGVVCKQKNWKELVACYAPLRRVEVEVKGEGVRR
ncbi:MAG: OmpA family protein [Burkholderiales bacterium]|nr:OmpA family protein [Burkholderiales bacterium]